MTRALLKGRPRGQNDSGGRLRTRNAEPRGSTIQSAQDRRCSGNCARSRRAASPAANRIAGPDCDCLRVQESCQLRSRPARVWARVEARRATGDFGLAEPGGFIGKIYAVYFRRVLPAIGRLICGKDGPYSYLPAPSRDSAACGDAGTDAGIGYTECAWQPYTFGIAGCTPACAAVKPESRMTLVAQNPLTRDTAGFSARSVA